MDTASKIKKKRISILGCGWLGFPLAKRLVHHDITSELKGSVTSLPKTELLKHAGIEAFVIELNPDFNDDEFLFQSFFDTDSLIITFPPRLSKNEPGFYPRQVAAVIEKIKNSPISEIIFVSSTGVYPDLNRIVVEQDVTMPDQAASPDMVAAENLLIELRKNLKVTILRHGGLIGYDRIPGKYVKGKKDITTGSLPVNYIHPDDAVGIMIKILEDGVQNETFNIVAPLHPTRREVYESTCQQFGWETPTFSNAENDQDFKIISGEKLLSFYDYDFKFPDPLKFYYELNAE